MDSLFPQSFYDKICPECKQPKTTGDFYKNKRRPDGLCRECKVCHSKRSREYGRRAYDYQKAMSRSLKRNYGLTEEQYWAMHQAQQGLCAACGQEEVLFDKRINAIARLSVDHDHQTGAVRALLCSGCNIALGAVKDSPERLLALVAYIQLY